MSEYRTASTRVATTGSKAGRVSGRITKPPRHEPGGELHAYRPGDENAACGLAVASLTLWPAKPFLWGHSTQRCRRCVEVASNGAPRPQPLR